VEEDADSMEVGRGVEAKAQSKRMRLYISWGRLSVPCTFKEVRCTKYRVVETK
jgi:hypothetical protein